MIPVLVCTVLWGLGNFSGEKGGRGNHKSPNYPSPSQFQLALTTTTPNTGTTQFYTYSHHYLNSGPKHSPPVAPFWPITTQPCPPPSGNEQELFYVVWRMWGGEGGRRSFLIYVCWGQRGGKGKSWRREIEVGGREITVRWEDILGILEECEWKRNRRRRSKSKKSRTRGERK